MRAIVITRHGGSDVLQVQQRPSPTLSPGGLRIEVRAAGVNFADVMARLGLYADAPPLPSVVGYEVSGLVTEIASDVTGFAVGDRVFAATRFGGYAEEVCVRQQDAVLLPAPLTFEQGAAIPVNYGTAWAGLIGYGSLRAGEHVLIQAAAGGVGIAATQIAKRYGATVYGTASPGKHDAIRRFGVDVSGLQQARVGPGPATVPSGHGCTRRHRDEAELREVASGWTPRCVWGELSGVRGHAQLARGSAAGVEHAPWVQCHESDVGFENGDRPEHAAVVGRPRHPRAMDNPAAGTDGRPAPSRRWSRTSYRSNVLRRRTRSSPSAETSERWCWCRKRHFS